MSILPLWLFFLYGCYSLCLFLLYGCSFMPVRVMEVSPQSLFPTSLFCSPYFIHLPLSRIFSLSLTCILNLRLLFLCSNNKLVTSSLPFLSTRPGLWYSRDLTVVVFSQFEQWAINTTCHFLFFTFNDKLLFYSLPVS